MNVDDVVAAYVKLRDAKTEMARRHKDELEPICTGMEKLENWLQKRLLEQGADSFKTKHGTAFFQSATSATVKDWNATLDFILTNQEWSFLEARVNKTAVKDYIETTGDAPPGVDYKETLVVRVRR
jgi:hypothetical protein